MKISDVEHHRMKCPECGGPAFGDLLLAEKKDACYYKVKASAKVWPSAYASGRLVQCRKKGAANYGKSRNESVEEAASAAQQAAIAINMKKAHKKPKNLREFAQTGGGDGGDYLRTLASAWYNDTYNTGSLQKGIKSQEDVERILSRGVVCPDGVTRKYYIDYNSDFDGVELISHDYYEHGDLDHTDSRTGKPFSAWDHIEYSDDQLDEDVSRRGFLKGAGAAAVAGAAGYGANKVINDPSKRWKMDVHNYDELDKEYKGKSFSITSNDKKMLLVVEPTKHEVTLIVNNGQDVLNSFSNLRMKIDNNPSESIDNIRGGIKYFSFTYPVDKILNANKILFQVAFLKSGETGRNPQQQDYRIITFVPGQQKESVSQGVAEGQLEFNTPNPVVVVQDLKGKILDKVNLSVAAQKYKLGNPQNIKNQLAHQDYTTVGNYVIVSPMGGQPQDATTQGVAEGLGDLSIQQLATISDEALDKAYGYGRSTPGNSFGWQANLKSAAYAKHIIDKGVTDIEAISDAIHKGWNVTAQAFVKNPDQFSDTEKLKAAGKLEAKLQQRAQLMKQNYAQLPEEEKEKDRVVARALLQAIKGQQGVAEGSDPWGPQGRFVGDTGPVRISATVPRHEFRPGDQVIYQPTGKRARLENLSPNGKVARISIESGMGGRTFDCKVSDLRAIGRGSLREFAPGDSGDDGFDDDVLKQLAAQWYNGDEDPRVEKTLAAAGWEIGQDEGYDDEPGVFVVQAGDINGRSYQSWPADELRGLMEKWSAKYKKSINCAHPKGFSQRAHCAGRKKNEETDVMETDELARLRELSGTAHYQELAEEFDLIESIIDSIAERNGVDAEAVWEDLESLTEDELYAFAVTSEPVMEDWQKANKRDKTDGMSQKAVNAYRREHPGSKLKTAVTTKPSKLKRGSKASKRRKSYCSRSRGQMKMHSISCSKTPDKAICKARRRWNC